MPLANRKPKKINPDGLYRAWQPAAIGSLAGTPVINPGMRLRGDDPRVQAAPHLFVSDGADDGEVAERWAAEFEVAAEVDGRGPVQPAPEPVRAEDLVVAARSLFAEDGHPIDAGTTLAKDHPAVEARADAFVDVLPTRLARRDALVALTTMSNETDEGVVTVYEGQWVPRDHPFVRVHPHCFAHPSPEQV